MRLLYALQRTVQHHEAAFGALDTDVRTRAQHTSSREITQELHDDYLPVTCQCVVDLTAIGPVPKIIRSTPRVGEMITRDHRCADEKIHRVLGAKATDKIPGECDRGLGDTS
jgi:hypothetical protein